MSRRFGRNRRRAMRAEIAARLLDNHRLQNTVESLKNRDAELEHFFLQVAMAVGSQAFISNTPTTIRLSDNIGEFFLINLRESAASRARLNRNEETHLLRREVMRLLKVGAIREAMSRQIIVRCQLGAGTVGYSFSDSLLRQMPPSIIAEQLAPILSTMLANAIAEVRER